MDPTYLRIANEFGITLCGACSEASRFEHLRGNVVAGRLHWALRQRHPRGLYRFLKLVWEMRYEDATDPQWWRVYSASKWATEYALHSLHLRIPASYTRFDRSMASYLLSSSATLDDERAQRVRRWAMRYR